MSQLNVSCPGCKRAYPVRVEDLQRSLVCKACKLTFKAEKIEDYILMDRLGEGMFGVVYRAWDARLKREVALKQLNERNVPEHEIESWVKRAVHEAEALAKIDFHPNVLPLYNAGYTGRKFYMVTPVIRGQSLDKIIPERGFPDQLTAINLGITILRALEHVHRFKVYHRDIKPSNMMQDENKNLFLVDFGLAAVQQIDFSSWSEMGTVLGTPAYMPPEQATGDVHRVGPWSDQYGAAAVIYKMLTGKVPYPGKGYVVLAAVADPKTQPIAPRQYRPNIDSELERIILKGISKFPGDRYGSCEELASALQRWADRSKGRATPDAFPVNQPARIAERIEKWPERKRKKKSPLPWILAILLVIGLAVGSYFALKEPNKKSTPAVKFDDFTK